MIEGLKEENQRLKRAVEELSILNEIGLAISSTLGVEKITELIVKKCTKHIRAEQGAIWLLSEEDKATPLKTFVRIMNSTFSGVPYHFGMSLTGWMLKNQEPLLINELAKDERFKGIERESEKIRSLLAVPLKLKNKMIGVLCLFNKKDNSDFTLDDQRLLSIIAIQSAQTIENARLYEEERKLLALEEDLRIARQIQQSLLPKCDPSIRGMEITGLSLPAKEVGGDYYDFIQIDDNHLGLAIADVSGKGTPAALLMANLQACLRGQALLNRSVKDTVTKANFMLSRFMEAGKFITLFYGILYLKEKRFIYTNAGHNFPIVLRSGGDLKKLEKGGLILGISESSKYEEETIQLESRDLLLLYTDGITEAINESGEMFEEERLLKLLRENQTVPARDLSRTIVNSVIAFQGTQPQEDDITLLLLRA
ncbi:MAG TPA: GAF domain-containing SpoIIE family protein phosphatase [Terriglobales bacterium]|nr:GAF domain-containing SpoIIE family protein phosphatase [Terriglobales bacterium]